MESELCVLKLLTCTKLKHPKILQQNIKTAEHPFLEHKKNEDTRIIQNYSKIS